MAFWVCNVKEIRGEHVPAPTLPPLMPACSAWALCGLFPGSYVWISMYESTQNCSHESGQKGLRSEAAVTPCSVEMCCENWAPCGGKEGRAAWQRRLQPWGPQRCNRHRYIFDTWRQLNMHLLHAEFWNLLSPAGHIVIIVPSCKDKHKPHPGSCLCISKCLQSDSKLRFV